MIKPRSPLKVSRRSGEQVAFISRVEEEAKQEPSTATCLTLVSKLVYFSTSEMSEDFQRTNRCYIPEDRTLHNHLRENLKSYIDICLLHEVLTKLKKKSCTLDEGLNYSPTTIKPHNFQLNYHI
jgi:hypothetical protein